MKENAASSLETARPKETLGKGWDWSPGDRVPRGGDSGGPIRFRDVSRLSHKDILYLASQAGHASLVRLEGIARNADPADRPLRRLLDKVISEEGEQARFIGEVERAVGTTTTLGIEGPVLEMTLREYFISHVCPFGEGYLDREAAMYFVESTIQELARFYSILGDGAQEQVLSKTFRGMAEVEESRLAFVRAVIMGNLSDGSAAGDGGAPRE